MYQVLVTGDSNDVIELAVAQRVTRSSCVITPKIALPNTEWFRESISYQGTTRWVNLPTHVKNVNSYEEFTKRIKDLYLKEFLSKGIVSLIEFVLTLD